eukprot:tig00001408_g8598.t1
MANKFPTRVAQTLTGHQGPVSVVRFNSDGSYCLTGGQDRLIKLWNPHKGLCVKTYKGHGYEVFDITSTKDNNRFASCGGDKVVFLWDVSTGRTIRKFQGHTARINALKFNGDETVIVSASYDGTMRAFDLRSQSQNAIQTIDNFKDSVTSVIITATEIVGGSVDGTIRRFDIRIGRVYTDTIGVPVTWMAVSNDGNCSVASCLDGTVRLFDKDSGELLNEYRGHKSGEYKVEACLSYGDEHVVSGSEDSRILFWDLVQSKVEQTLVGHTGVVSSLAYHPTATCLVSAATDGTVKCWKTPAAAE